MATCRRALQSQTDAQRAGLKKSLSTDITRSQEKSATSGFAGGRWHVKRAWTFCGTFFRGASLRSRELRRGHVSGRLLTTVDPADMRVLVNTRPGCVAARAQSRRVRWPPFPAVYHITTSSARLTGPVSMPTAQVTDGLSKSSRKSRWTPVGFPPRPRQCAAGSFFFFLEAFPASVLKTCFPIAGGVASYFLRASSV